MQDFRWTDRSGRPLSDDQIVWCDDISCSYCYCTHCCVPWLYIHARREDIRAAVFMTRCKVKGSDLRKDMYEEYKVYFKEAAEDCTESDDEEGNKPLVMSFNDWLADCCFWDMDPCEGCMDWTTGAECNEKREYARRCGPCEHRRSMKQARLE